MLLNVKKIGAVFLDSIYHKMNLRKHTRCPYCSNIYQVSIDHLTISKGWVRCVECRYVFNAVENLYYATPLKNQQVNYLQQSYPADDIHQFFHQKIEQSNIDLLDYLDGLDYRLHRKSDDPHYQEIYTEQNNETFNGLQLLFIFLVLASMGLAAKYFYLISDRMQN